MSSKTLDIAFEIGRYMSEYGEWFEGFVEYRVEALNALKSKLKNIEIPPQIKENLFVTLFTIQKSQTLYEYYRWQKHQLDVVPQTCSIQDIHNNISSKSITIEKQIDETLQTSNISIDHIQKNYKNIIRCIDEIALKIKSSGYSSVDESFILDVFNVKNKHNYIKK